MSALSTMQVWTTPLWLVLMVGPFVYLVVADPASASSWLAYEGGDGGTGISLTAIGLGAGVALSLMAQIGEQVDYLRFMPAKTAENKRAWWASVIAAGPGWVLLGGLKQAAGAFLAVHVVGRLGAAAAVEPVRQFNATLTTRCSGGAARLRCRWRSAAAPGSRRCTSGRTRSASTRSRSGGTTPARPRCFPPSLRRRSAARPRRFP